MPAGTGPGTTRHRATAAEASGTQIPEHRIRTLRNPRGYRSHHIQIEPSLRAQHMSNDHPA
jgi:hypothetical protein